jgi:hypothetical protein
MVRPDTTWFGARGVHALTRYDLVLALVPLVFLAGALGSFLMPERSQLFVGTAGIIAAALLADSVYFNPPGSGSGSL